MTFLSHYFLQVNSGIVISSICWKGSEEDFPPGKWNFIFVTGIRLVQSRRHDNLQTDSWKVCIRFIGIYIHMVLHLCACGRFWAEAYNMENDVEVYTDLFWYYENLQNRCL